ncbi:MAG TPA: hypothetical protein PK286_11265 [Devosia sp.]|nr:hypothetical protein [Devosia sp.]
MVTKQDILKQRLAEVLDDLKTSGGRDPETMWLIGSLTADLTSKVKANSWKEFKETMSPATYDKLLNDFQDVGNRLYQDGIIKRAYAMQALGLSLVCSTQRQDPMIANGEILLDAVIEGAVKLYRKVEKTH